MIDYSDNIDSLTESIHQLIEKLNSIVVEMYEFNSSVTGLKNTIRDLIDSNGGTY